MWTLVYKGMEKSLADWGVCDDFSKEKDNKGLGTVTLRTTERFDGGATQWKAAVNPSTLAAGAWTLQEMDAPTVIWRDRTDIGEGGTIWAQGWFDDPERVNEGGIEHVVYRLHNVWWLLTQHVYQHPRRVVTGFTGSAGSPTYQYTNTFTPEVFLGEALSDGPDGYTTLLCTNGAEITAILGWVNECFNARKRGATVGRTNAGDVLQLGTIEPAVYPGISRRAGIYCSEAIIEMLRLQPDSIVWVDETTTPPTVNVRTLGKWNYGTVPPAFVDYTNLPEVVVNITAEQERQVIVQGQVCQAPPVVMIWWWGANQIMSDGQTITAPFSVIDVYPPGSSLYTPRASLHFAVVQGSSQTTETADVTTEPLSALLAGNQAAQVAWWIAHDRTLADPMVDPATIVVGAPTIVDASGAALDTEAWPNILVDSSLPKWTSTLGLGWRRATIRCPVQFTRYADAAHKVPEVKASTRMVHKTVKVTNAETYSYRATTSYTPGDQIPAGVAESAWRAMNAQQWQGSIEFVEQQVRSDIGIGCRLKLVGPTTTFSNVLPQRIVERPCSGSMAVTYGPAPRFSIDALFALQQALRARTTWRLPSGRDTGQDAGQGETDSGADVPTEDTAHSPGGFVEFGGSYQQS